MFGHMHIQLQFYSPVIKDEDFSLRLALAPMAELHFQLKVSIVVFFFLWNSLFHSLHLCTTGNSQELLRGHAGCLWCHWCMVAQFRAVLRHSYSILVSVAGERVLGILH